MKKHRRRRFQRKLKYKYMAACIGISLFLVLILTGSYYGYFNKLFVTQTQDYVFNMAEQSKDSLELTMRQIDSVILSIQSETMVQEFLTKIDKGTYGAYEEYLAREKVRQGIYADIMWEDSVVNVYLESDQGYSEVWEKSGGGVIWNKQKKEQIYGGKGRTVWLGVDESGKFMQAGAQINSTKNLKPLGFVMIQMPVEDFENQINKYSFIRNGLTMIISRSEGVIVTTDPALSADGLDTLGRRFMSGHVREDVYSIDFGGEKYYAVISDLRYNDWRLITLIPKMNYSEVLYELRFYIFAVVMVVLFVSFIIILILAERFTKNIKELQGAMERFGEGDFNVICAVHSDDEVGQLSQHFNMMVYNINDLIDRVYNETMLRQEAELKSLRMQINPHFLYNTLDMMSWISRNRGVPEVGEVAVSLGNILRYTINGSDFATIGEELEHIRNYFMIQHCRYGDRIHFNIDVPREVLDIQIPKLLIQPLIENAVVHGVENLEADGVVTLKADLDRQNLYISVIDNGVGMSQEKIDAILNDDNGIPLEVRESIGLKNVNRRLKIRYGEFHGLRMRSVLGKGTEVKMCIPYLS